MAAALADFLKSRTFLEGLGVHDIGDRPEAPRLGVGARGPIPPVRAHTQLLGEQGDEDLGLLLPEAGERL